MIKRPVLPLMLLTLASIFLFFLLNLLLGSVHIPLRVEHIVGKYG